MFAELRQLFAAINGTATKDDYRRAAVELNVLGKRTASNRKLTFQRLAELYGLDPSIPLFRYFHFLWQHDVPGRPLLALLCSMARDPLLRMSDDVILSAPEGTKIGTRDFERVLFEKTVDRFNPLIVTKIARNIAASWTQAGYLRGRAHKTRCQPTRTPGAVALALFLGYLEGYRAQRLLETQWVRVFDIPKDRLLALAAEAARRGDLQMLNAGQIIEIRFPGHLTKQEEELTRESH